MFQKKYLASGVILVMLITALGIVMANTPVRTPDGFDKFVVFMAAGQYDPSVPPAEENLAMWFHKEIMGRTDLGIDQQKLDAKGYFSTQFGIDVSVEDLILFGVDPRNEYRAYIISGMDVPSEGWVVRDGGIMHMLMTDTTLYGAYGGLSGIPVPAGSFIVYGDYNIDMTGPGKSGKHPSYVEPIIIHYQSAEPILPTDIHGGITFRCTVIAPWGEGIAQGTSYPQTVDGFTLANIRNVHTYPEYGPSILHDSP